MQILGSASLAAQLVEHDLVDEYRLMIEPILLGGGKRIFPERRPGASARARLDDDRGHRRADLQLPPGARLSEPALVRWAVMGVDAAPAPLVLADDRRVGALAAELIVNRLLARPHARLRLEPGRAPDSMFAALRAHAEAGELPCANATILQLEECAGATTVAERLRGGAARRHARRAADDRRRRRRTWDAEAERHAAAGRVGAGRSGGARPRRGRARRARRAARPPGLGRAARRAGHRR